MISLFFQINMNLANLLKIVHKFSKTVRQINITKISSVKIPSALEIQIRCTRIFSYRNHENSRLKLQLSFDFPDVTFFPYLVLCRRTQKAKRGKEGWELMLMKILYKHGKRLDDCWKEFCKGCHQCT